MNLSHRTPQTDVAKLAGRLQQVRRRLVEVEANVDLAAFGPRAESASNLLHYLAFRGFDLRREQARLAHWGLSSLGRSESHVLYNLDTVLGWLGLRMGTPGDRLPAPTGPDPERGRQLLGRAARNLLGGTRPGRGTRIMVTLPTEAAYDYRLVHDLVERGMDCARINCAHDTPTQWSAMINHLRRAERALGRRCRLEMDLAGPKIRTGTMGPGPAVVKLRPTRDVLGRTVAPDSVWLVPHGEPASVPEGEKRIPVPAAWLRRRRIRDRIQLVDARGARRTLRIVGRRGPCLRAAARKTTYLTPGTRLTSGPGAEARDIGVIGALPPVARRIRLRVGERLLLTAAQIDGEEARRSPSGRVVRLPHISCTLPEALPFVRTGESVWFDDGRIGGTVRAASPARLVVEVTHAPSEGAWLSADRGINLPDTALDLPAIPPDDLASLTFVVRRADLVGFSFVHSPADVGRLRAELARRGRPRMGIVLKIETRRGFAELPGILLAALQQPPAAVMIARGDLGVEVGFERLAEVQEEILWLCEAAHVPAIWATQVLEGLTKTGLPSRAEVTDAAMGERAECVMLNKGPHVVEAVGALDGILRRMASHQAKKTAMLRHLQVVDSFIQSPEPRRRSGQVPTGRPGARRSPVGTMRSFPDPGS